MEKRNVQLTCAEVSAIAESLDVKSKNHTMMFRIQGDIIAAKKAAKPYIDAKKDVNAFNSSKEIADYQKAIEQAKLDCVKRGEDGNPISVGEGFAVDQAKFALKVNEIDKRFPEVTEKRNELFERLNAFGSMVVTIPVLTLEGVWIKTLSLRNIQMLSWMMPIVVESKDLPEEIELSTLNAMQAYCQVVENASDAVKMTDEDFFREPVEQVTEDDIN